jgi:hypothetical protein
MMSGAAGSIAALAHGPGRIEKNKSKISSAGPIRENHIDFTRHPPALKLKTHLKAASCARNFLLQQRQTA